MLCQGGDEAGGAGHFAFGMLGASIGNFKVRAWFHVKRQAKRAKGESFWNSDSYFCLTQPHLPYFSSDHLVGCCRGSNSVELCPCNGQVGWIDFLDVPSSQSHSTVSQKASQPKFVCTQSLQGQRIQEVWFCSWVCIVMHFLSHMPAHEVPVHFRA